MKYVLLAALLGLSSCVTTTRVSAFTGYSLSISNHWEELNSAEVGAINNQVETKTYGNRDSKVIVIFTTLQKMPAQLLVMNFWIHFSSDEAIQATDPTTSRLMDAGFEFSAVYKDTHARFYFLDGKKYTYVIQVFTPVNQGLDYETVQLLKSFRID